MKGKILGATAQGGAISGEDGKRYQFESAQWKGERAPVQGDDVDFEPDGAGKAKDIYALRSAAALDLGAVGSHAKALLGDSANSPLGARLMTLLTGNTVFQISLVVLIASCFLTFVKLSPGVSPVAAEALPDRGVYKIVNTGDLIDYLKSSLGAAAASMDQLTQTADTIAPYNGGATPSPFGNTREAAANLRGASGLSNILYVLYLAPIGAAAIIVQLLRHKGLSLIPLATGIACLASFALLVLCRSSIISAVGKMGNANAADVAANAIVFGFGSYVILICGLALAGLSLGLVKLPQRT